MYAYLRQKVEKKTRKIIGHLRRLLDIEYRSALGERELFELLEGKSVALVGNASRLADDCCGEDIDAHDLIIRFNRAPMPNARSHGTRTDMIATSIPLERTLMEGRGARHLLWMSPPQDAIPRWIARLSTLFLYSAEHHGRLRERIRSRPTTGLMVIELLSRSGCRKIDLYGFDFFASASLSDNRARRSSPHSGAAEKRYVMDLIASDLRFSLN
ncbi:glycosyltransferase family 29 protein [Rhizobium sp. ARZ01]|uniref:glycosyltransferase family 29 protein n=1 Tax=Rhizobium sp. ARZ01 TaxID=2769313 RepID=UPI00177BF2C5|nr:glycosyltransferase family 29 protein [Rhizobium sp. ARZ01]MBD9373244.1 glycosyltransferase family 29 protein [Rhizobium sp. ARZ01]